MPEKALKVDPGVCSGNRAVEKRAVFRIRQHTANTSCRIGITSLIDKIGRVEIGVVRIDENGTRLRIEHDDTTAGRFHHPILVCTPAKFENLAFQLFKSALLQFQIDRHLHFVPGNR